MHTGSLQAAVTPVPTGNGEFSGSTLTLGGAGLNYAALPRGATPRGIAL